MASEQASDISHRRRQAALAVVDGYNACTMADIMKPRAPECVHVLLPESLNRPILNNATYEAFFGPRMKLMRNFNVVVKETFVDATENRVAIWANGTADTDFGPYTNEYMLIVYLDDQCDRATRIVEWVDSAASIEFVGRYQKFMADKAAAPDS